jgi:NAD-dependent SIR2 family protein deacetylase
MAEKVKCVGCGKALKDEDYTPGDPKVCMKCWKCPKCGTPAHPRDEGGEELDGCIMEGDEGYVNCYHCEEGFTYEEFEKAIAKKGSMEKCPICKGTGLVPKTKKERTR